MPLPKQVIDDLMNDQDFMALPEAEQDIYIDRIAAKYGNVPKAENILQRALKPIIKAYTDPQLSMIPGAQGYFAAQGGRESIIDDQIKDPIASFALKTISDPTMWVAGKAAGKGVGDFVENVKDPSSVFGKKIDALQAANPTKRVDFLKTILNASDDPATKKVIDKSGIMSRFGGRTLTPEGGVTENLSNLTLKDSQELINAMKSEVRQAVKEGIVKPKEIGIAKMFGELPKAQDEAFEGFKGARKFYGVGKNIGKATKAAKKTAITGAVLGATGTVGHSFIKSLFGNK